MSPFAETLTTVAGTFTTVIALFVCLIGSTQRAAAQSTSKEVFALVRVHTENRSELDTLLEMEAADRGFEIWSDAIGTGPLEVRASARHRRSLDEAGLPYEILIEDLLQHTEALFAQSGSTHFFDSYQTYDQNVAFLADLVEDYPDLAELINLGSSVQGRPLWAIRITGPGADKPGVMFHGAQHGNELTGAVVVAYMAEYLLTRYDSDPYVRELVDGVEWFLLPIMNPDGWVAGQRFNANGKDLNRNWGGAHAYPNPFSEPETAAMRDFFLSHPNVRAYVDFHTFGNMIMWPWEYKGALCEDHETFRKIGSEMSDRIREVRGTFYFRLGTVYSTMYSLRGGSTDYAYGELGLWAFTVEIDFSNRAVPPSEILPTAREMAQSMLVLAEWVSDCNTNGTADHVDLAAGESADCNSNDTPDECEVQRDFDADGAIDICDTDADNDGVANEWDKCEFTPLEFPTTPGGHLAIDTNANCEVDLSDYWRFMDCLDRGGPGGTPRFDACGASFDLDADGCVNLLDFADFSTLFGPMP